MLSRISRPSILRFAQTSVLRPLTTTVPSYMLNIPPTDVSTMANGIRVASQEFYGKTCSIGIFIDTGSRYENDNTNGVAHFVEHLSFKGTSRRSKRDIEYRIEQLGAHLNAYTSREQTVYYSRCFANDAPEIIDLLSDILLHSKFEERDVNNERHTILLEAEDVFKNKYEETFDLLHAAAYAGCGLGYTILGPEKNIRRITPTDLRTYTNTHYTAPRVVVAGAGAIEHARLVDLAERTFHDLPVFPRNGVVVPPLSKVFGSRIQKYQDDYPVASIAVGFEGKGWKDRDAIAYMLLQSMFGSWTRAAGNIGADSYLCATVANANLAHCVENFLTTYKDTAIIGTYAECERDQIPELMRVVMQSFREMGSSITAERLALTKRQLKSTLLMRLDGSPTVLEDIGRQIQMYGRRLTPAEIIMRVEAVTLDQMQDLANRTFINTPVAVGAYGPVDNLPPIEWFLSQNRS